MSVNNEKLREELEHLKFLTLHGRGTYNGVLFKGMDEQDNRFKFDEFGEPIEWNADWAVVTLQELYSHPNIRKILETMKPQQLVSQQNHALK